jgi:acetolactate synthase I/II/III large subunit
MVSDDLVKLSDYVADFVAEQGIRTAFAITGGASLHLIHSMSKHADITVISPHHEQAAAMSADAYARASGGLGLAVATSGPGATNLVTGICCSYFDSIPVLYLTGQVSTFRFKGDTGVRQMGFQETDIVSMCRDVTKYATQLTDPTRVRYELEKAVWIARSGRPGPVLVDIPDDLQRVMIDPARLASFMPPVAPPPREISTAINTLLERLQHAKRPVIILGWGVRLAGAEKLAIALIERLGIPVVPTWGMLDLLPYGHPLLVGAFGTHGLRSGNYTVQNADFVLALGSRLDTHEIGTPASDFARGAYKVVVDIDPAEVKKFAAFGLLIDQPLVADAHDFLTATHTALDAPNMPTWPIWSEWKTRIADWQVRYPAIDPACRQSKTLNPYAFIETLSAAATPGLPIVVDTGCAVAWMSQAFRFKPGQRYFHAFNNTPMGYAVPAAVGISLAKAGQQVICVVGDGALQMNVQELATVAYHRLPLKIFVLDNQGYGMIQQTQDQWFNGRYFASSPAGGLGFPDFVALAQAYGIPARALRSNQEVNQQIPEILAAEGPQLCNIVISPAERVAPQVKYGRGIEDGEPLLPREEFLANMIIPPLPGSLS